MTISENARFRRSTSVVSQEIASSTLVVPIRGGVGDLDAVFSFNPIGAEIWGLMDKGATLGEMASWVESQYDVSLTTTLEDLRIFVDALVAAGLATIGPQPSVGSTSCKPLAQIALRSAL